MYSISVFTNKVFFFVGHFKRTYLGYFLGLHPSIFSDLCSDHEETTGYPEKAWRKIHPERRRNSGWFPQNIDRRSPIFCSRQNCRLFQCRWGAKTERCSCHNFCFNRKTQKIRFNEFWMAWNVEPLYNWDCSKPGESLALGGNIFSGHERRVLDLRFGRSRAELCLLWNLRSTR